MLITSSDPNTLEQTKAVLERLLHEGIKPHAATIARVHAAGEVAVVFFDIAMSHIDDVTPLRALGWKGGRSECVSMNRTRAEKFADWLPPADPCSKWLRGRRPGRILVWTGIGSLCINHHPGVGFSLEPGTTDCEWMS